MSIPSLHNPRRQKGISLIELIIFIIIISAALAGILSVMNVTNKASPNPMISKQAIAIAESLLEEIELQPFTYCDPNDPLLEDPTVTSSAMCTTPQGLGAAGKTRYASPQFSNVGDYHGFAMGPLGGNPANPVIADITNTPVPGLDGYTASVNITQAGAAFGFPAGDVLQINVRVQFGTTDITLTGYRFRYAPHTGP